MKAQFALKWVLGCEKCNLQFRAIKLKKQFNDFFLKFTYTPFHVMLRLKFKYMEFHVVSTKIPYWSMEEDENYRYHKFTPRKEQ